jgi:hypothetical protein
MDMKSKGKKSDKSFSPEDKLVADFLRASVILSSPQVCELVCACARERVDLDVGILCMHSFVSTFMYEY